MRKYTVEELDELERLATNKFIWGDYRPRPAGGLGRPYRDKDLIEFVRHKMDTWIQSGIVPEDF